MELPHTRIGREQRSRPIRLDCSTAYFFFFLAAFFTAFFAAFFLAGNFRDPLSARRGCLTFGITYHPG